MWTHITQYLPGDDRIIQIWLPESIYIQGHGNIPAGNWIGFYRVDQRQFTGLISPKGQVYENGMPLRNVNHWAETLSKPNP